MEDIEILVNKDNLLDEKYIPNNLIETDQNENNFHKYIDPNLKPMVSNLIINDFFDLKKQALYDGFYFVIGSWYRSYKYQKAVWDYNVNKFGLEKTMIKVAIPGASEHQTGLAIDISVLRNGIFDTNYDLNDDEINWLINNSYKYGFILRYPKDKENITGIIYEPWHYRYVGKDLAYYLYENNITLEEYKLQLKNGKSL